jgi:hypothetical protein
MSDTQKNYAELSESLSIPISETLRLTYRFKDGSISDINNVLYTFDSLSAFKTLGAFRTAKVEPDPGLDVTPRLAIVETAAGSNKFKIFHAGDRFNIKATVTLTDIHWSFLSLVAWAGPGSAWPALNRNADLLVKETPFREVVEAPTKFTPGTKIAVGFDNLATAIGDTSLLRYVLMTNRYNSKYETVVFRDEGSGADENVICNLCANGYLTESVCSYYNCATTI